MTDFEIEDMLDDRYSFTASDAIERSTGWKDSYCVKFPDGEVEFFDAEANELYPCSPIRDLAVAISQLEDAIEDAFADEDVREFEGRNRSMALEIAIGVEDF